jgi:hypothetical protein
MGLGVGRLGKLGYNSIIFEEKKIIKKKSWGL